MELDYWDEEIMDVFRISYDVVRGYDPASYSLVYLDPKYSYMKDSYDLLTGYPYVYESGIYAVLDWSATINMSTNPKPDCAVSGATWSDTTAHLTGTVNPNTRPATVTFRISTFPPDQANNFTYYNETPSVSASGSSAIPFYSDWTFLTPGTTYYYQIRAVSDGGVCQSAPGSFTTSSPPPPQNATLSIYVDGQGIVTNVYPLLPVLNTGSFLFVTYPFNTWVGLLATSATGYGFAGWGYADAGFSCSGAGQCNLQLNTSKSVAAVFAPLKTLTVTKSGAGIGTVISSAPTSPMINCGPTCSNSYLSYNAASVGTVVTLSAIPDPGTSFTGWSGACSGTGPCSIIMNTDRTVSASFIATNPVQAGTVYYATAQAAYDNVVTGSEIKLIAASFNESPNFNRPVDVTILGGYNSNFTARVGITAINGVMTISSGTVIVDGLQLGGPSY